MVGRKINYRTLALLGVLAPLLALFGYAALSSGPLAPVPVTLTRVVEAPLAPALFGVGTVAARYTYRIGPTIAGRVSRVEVQVGDRVKAGQVLGEMDPVDLDDRVQAQDAALRRAESGVVAAQAQVRDGLARRDYATAQVHRYEQLLQQRTASEDTAGAKRQEAQVAEAGLALAQANLESAEQELKRVRAEREALVRQRANLRLVAPVDALVVSRDAEPGSTVVAGQSVVEVIDPGSLWVDARFDQLAAAGLRADLPARIGLRSRPGAFVEGQVLRVEPRADAVTEELRAKVVFASPPDPLPAEGELAEVTVALGALPAAPVLPNAALHRIDGRLGVWVLDPAGLRFAVVETGAADLEGQVQIRSGVRVGDEVVLYSRSPLSAHSRVSLVEQVPGVPR
jgi:RND family efflux transporter MFP subunit